MNSSATLTGCDDIIKRLRAAIGWLRAQQYIFDSHPKTATDKTPGSIADNIAALLARLDAAERENERLRKFAGKVLDKSREEFLEMSCGDIEDWAKQFGLLELVTMSAACGDDCSCAEWSDFPAECFRPTALGSAAIDAAMAAEQSDERREG